MKHIYSINDLVPFGINPLTGESCAYGMRILCDLSSHGAQLVSDFLGMPYDCDNPGAHFQPNWNSKVGSAESVASIMLSRSVFPELIRFILFRADNCAYVISTPDGAHIGIRADDEYAQRHLDLASDRMVKGLNYGIHRNTALGGTGRNEHAFTGRTV